MEFINALELLELDKIELSSIDNSIIKKSKKKLLAEIELSDANSINYRGKKIIKSDIERIISDLEDENKIRFYYELLKLPKLNNFLISGDTSFFIKYQSSPIYKNITFIEFISPYFAFQYDKQIYNAFISNDEKQIQSLVNDSPLVTNGYIDICYKSLYSYLKEQVEEFNVLYKDIKNENIDEDDLIDDNILDKINKKVKISSINKLPQYFESTRNQIAKSVRDVSVAIFNAFDNSDLSFKLIDLVLTIKIDELNKRKFLDDYNKIKEINDERLNNEKYSNDIDKCVNVLSQLKNIHNAINLKNTDYKKLIKNISQIVDIEYINSLPEFLKDLQNQIALTLRNLAIEVINTNNDIENSFILIELSRKIKKIDKEMQCKINEDYNTINKIYEQKKKYGEPIKKFPICILRMDVEQQFMEILCIFVFFIFLFFQLQDMHVNLHL